MNSTLLPENTFVDVDLVALRSQLAHEGMALVQIEPGDEAGRGMQRIVAELGAACTHHAGGDEVWNIRFDPAAGDAGTRSRTMKEFPLHTDGAFEEPAPRYIAQYVVREDRFGGGESLLLNVADILVQLSPETCDILRHTHFRFCTPREFDKGLAYNDLPILFGDGLVRFRREIIDESACSLDQIAALDEVDVAIDALEPMRFQLPSGALLLLDNARFLHARTAVLDPQRHLLRMRFSM